MPTLSDLPQMLPIDEQPKIYTKVNEELGHVLFDHIDGAYSFCRAYNADGQLVGSCHLAAWTPLEPFMDGYRIVTEEEEDIDANT